MLYFLCLQAKKSVFSGFGGFNKTQPASFDFLSKLTNGDKTNGDNKKENTVSSSIFTNSALVSGTSTGLFSIPVSNTASKTTLKLGTVNTPSLFGISSSSSGTTNTDPFTASKANSGDSPFKMTSSNFNPDIGGFQVKSSSNVIPSQISSTITTATNNSLFSSSAISPGPTPFKIQSVTSATFTNTSNNNIKSSESKTENANEAKMAYYSKLKGLNESVSDWIKKHVVETPLCILTPIFNDYEKYLKEIQEEYHSGGNDSKKDEGTAAPAKNTSQISSNLQSTPKSTSSLLSSTSSGPNSLSALKTAPARVSEEKPTQPFSFGATTTATTTAGTAIISTSGFSFGINTQAKRSSDQPAKSAFGSEQHSILPFGSEKPPFAAENPNASTFSFSANSTSVGAPSAPFSFGTGQKFSFSPNTQQKPETVSEQKNENEDEDEPPKVDFTPIVEENSVFDKRCKVFVKKDGNFTDKGIATLYIKKIDNSPKHQLVVRANNNLGNVLLNLVLASGIPTQRMGKNNVMMVCIPIPDAKPPPTPVLIRVKTSEEADELLEILNKYKA